MCRRVLRNYHDAEDAFQATFLVLVRKAASLAAPELLANWLYGVAHQTALKARATTAKRRGRERQVTQMPEPAAVEQAHWRDLQPLLDDELSRLPDKYRAAIVLCDLEGKTRKDAARQFGVPEGTLAARVARGRGLLTKRLARHGLAVSGGSLAALLVSKASAGVPTAVVSSTIKAASLYAAGPAAATGVISAKVAALAEGVVKAIFIGKLKIATLLLVVLVGFGAGVKMALVSAAEPPGKEKATRQAAEKQEQPQAAPTWKIGPTLQGHGDEVWEVAFSPDGKRLASSSRDKSVLLWDVAKRESVHTLTHAGIINSIAFAPDGKTLATASGYGSEDYSINLWDPETGKQQAVLKGHTNPVHRLSFSRDGKILVSANGSFKFTQAGDKGDVFFWDVGTKKKIATLKCDRVHTAILSDDGKKLVTAHGDGTVKLWELDDKFSATRETVLVENLVCGVRVSPDGKTFVIVPVNHAPSIDLWDFETGRVLRSFEHKEVSVRDAAFAPDGKTLATGCRGTIKNGDVFEPGGEVKFWDVVTGEEKQALREKFGPVNGLTFAADGKTLAVGLLHKENVKLKGEEGKLKGEGGGFERPADGYRGVVVLCELKKGKP